MDSDLGLRLARPEDMEFLCRVYASTRETEMTLVDWSDEQKDEFLTMQFNAQHQHYRTHYPQAQYLVILWEGKPIGRLYIDWWTDQIRIVDISLLPEYRNRGIGTMLLQDILAEGRRCGLPVTIHVEVFNPAMSLYRRLGFRKIGEHGDVYWLMEWSPDTIDAKGNERAG